MESIIKIVYDYGNNISSDSSVLGISLDTLAEAFVTVLLFVSGYLLNQFTQKRNEESRLKDLKDYIFGLIDLMENPLCQQKNELLSLADFLKKKKEENYFPVDRTIFQINRLAEANSGDLYKIFLVHAKGNIGQRSSNYSGLMDSIELIKSIKDSINPDIIKYDKALTEHINEYVRNLGIVKSKYDEMMTYYIANKLTRPPFMEKMGNITLNWINTTGIDYKLRFVSFNKYVTPVKKLCEEFAGTHEALIFHENVNECKYSYDSIENIRKVYRRHFLLNAWNLRKGMNRIKSSVDRLESTL